MKKGNPLAEDTKKKTDRKAKAGKKADAGKKLRTPGRKTSWRGLFILTEVLAVVLLIVAIVFGLSVWRLKSGPVDISFSKDYIQSALRSDKDGVYVTLETASLHWPDLKGPLLLDIKGSRIFGSDNREVMHVEGIALSLSKAKLLIGKIEPLSLIIKQPSLRIIRSEDNQFDFGFGTSETIATQEVDEQSKDQEDLIADILRAFRQQEKVKDNSPLASLQSFEIKDARTIIEDHKLGATWFFPDFNIRFENVATGLKTDLSIELPSYDEGKRSYMELAMVLNETDSTADFQAALQNFDLEMFAGKFDALEALRGQDVLLNGSFTGKLDKGFMPIEVVAEMNAEGGHINHEMLSEEPFPYKNITVRAAYNNKGGHVLTIESMELAIGDAVIRAQGGLKQNQGGEQEYSGDVVLEIDDMPHSAIEPLWPAFLVGDSSEEWIVKKMGGGEVSGLKAEADIRVSKDDAEEWGADISGLMAYFSFANMDMDYRAPLPPVKKANGSGVFNLDTDIMTIDINDAELGGMRVSKTGLTFKDVAAEGKGSLEMSIHLSGPLRSVFEYISTEPIDLKEALDMDVSSVKGDTDLQVDMSFPTKDDLQIEEIKMDIKGTVTNGYLPDILEGLPLEGGPYQVHVNNERYTVKGKGTFSGRPVSVDWIEYLDSKGKDFKSKAQVSITVDEALRKHFGIDLTEFLEGSVPVNLVYKSLAGEKSEIYIDADATPATFFVKPFGYDKPPGQKGQATMTVHLENNILNRISNLDGSAPGFDVKDATLLFKGSGEQTSLTQARIQRFAIGETIAGASIDIAPNGLIKVLMEGPFLDLRPFVNNEGEKNPESYDNPPQIISVSVDQMRTADEQTVQYAKIYADIDNKGRFNQLELDAIAGSGDVYMRYKPDAQGKRTFRFEADDAGAALKAFDVYKNIRGGKLVIYGEPIRGVYDRNLVGVAQITDFKVVDAPSLARLLGALSLPGVLQLLNDDGLSFSKLEAGFDWLYRPKGALLVLKDGRTTGNSLGLTFDGTFDNAAMTVDVSGTIIPLSGINKAISSIPLIGDILSGGSGAIFAATYSMKGKSEEPKISVNPLSVLTPGILRRILFE